jgi:hypothetical protein
VREIVHHVALALALLALLSASLRVASKVSPAGLERAVVAVVIAAAAAVTQALALGLVGLGGSPVALCVATGALWAVSLLCLPTPEVGISTEVAAWWRRLDLPWRLAVAALGGAFAAWVAWQLRYPSIGFDSAVYHYPEVAGWIQNGRPGSVLRLSYDIPYGNYPLTDEVVQTWGAAIARSWVPLALWNPAMLLVLAGAGWLALRNLSVSRAVAGLATAVLVASPLLIRQLNEPQTDLPAVTWLACSLALALGARSRPGLLVPAVVAAGLAVGTKTTVAPVALVALGTGAYLARGRLRPLTGWLLLGAAAAYVVGGLWYTRNIVQHGWPLWPFTEAPWSDPPPRFFSLIETTFLERPAATLEGRLGEYASRLGGGWVMMAGALVALIFGALAVHLKRALRRPLVVAGATTLGALLVWSVAWGTGLQTAAELPGADGWPLSAIRYLLPVTGAGLVTVALATRVPGLAGRAAIALLAAALVWSLVADARLGAPHTPSVLVLLVGALAGLLALGAAALAARGVRRRVPAGMVAALAAVALGVVLAPAATGYIERSTEVSESTAPGADVVAWFLSQPGFEEEEGTIAFASRAAFGQLAGDDFSKRLYLIPRRASCRGVARLARRTSVLLVDESWFSGILGIVPYSAGRCLTRRPPGFQNPVYRVYRPRYDSLSAGTWATSSTDRFPRLSPGPPEAAR